MIEVLQRCFSFSWQHNKEPIFITKMFHTNLFMCLCPIPNSSAIYNVLHDQKEVTSDDTELELP